jgi:hypothetical protein
VCEGFGGGFWGGVCQGMCAACVWQVCGT